MLRLTRAGVAWQALGVAVGAYEARSPTRRTRVQFGKPIASFQLVQQKLANALANITAPRALRARLGDAGRGHPERRALAMAKAFVTARMRETVALCREICGGNGVSPSRRSRGRRRPLLRRCRGGLTFEGTFDMNTLIVGRAITGIAALV